MDPTPLQQDGTLVESSRRRRCSTDNRNRQVSGLVVNIETGAKLSETIGAVDELSTSHVELTMTGEEERDEEEKEEMCNK